MNTCTGTIVSSNGANPKACPLYAGRVGDAAKAGANVTQTNAAGNTSRVLASDDFVRRSAGLEEAQQARPQQQHKLRIASGTVGRTNTGNPGTYSLAKGEAWREYERPDRTAQGRRPAPAGGWKGLLLGCETCDRAVSCTASGGQTRETFAGSACSGEKETHQS